METLPDFELLAHELPPASTEPLCAPANARIAVEGKEVLLRVVKVEKWRYVVFLRRDGQNFILRNPSSKTPGVMIWKEPPKQRKLERIGRLAQKWPGQFAPCQFLVVRDAKGTPRAALSLGHHFKAWRSSGFSARWLQGDLSDGFQFSFEDQGDVLSSLQKAVEESDSFANRMWQLQGMTLEERAAFYKAKRRAHASRPFLLRLWKRLLGLH